MIIIVGITALGVLCGLGWLCFVAWKLLVLSRRTEKWLYIVSRVLAKTQGKTPMQILRGTTGGLKGLGGNW